MRRSSRSSRYFTLGAIVVGASLMLGCTERSPDSVTGPALRAQFGVPNSDDIRAAIAAQERHNPALLRIPGVVGTAVG
ncbi:MAG: hypothetical protein ACREUQ_08720, partial [Burkholderiales bacterium]